MHPRTRPASGGGHAGLAGFDLPGASDRDAFWRFLRDGVDAIHEVPTTRFDIDHFYDLASGTPGKLSSRWAGFLDDIDRFDAALPRTAAGPRALTIHRHQSRLLTHDHAPGVT